jgi:hypothetical protein
LTHIKRERMHVRKKPVKAGPSEETNFTLKTIEMMLNQAGRKTVRENESIRIPTDAGDTVVSSKRIRASTIDGFKIADRVTVKTEIPEQFRPAMSQRAAAILNAFAGLSALVCDTQTGSVFIGSRLTIYKTEEQALDFFMPLLALSAFLQVRVLAQTVVKLLTGRSGYPHPTESNAPSLWSGGDLEETCNALDGINVVSSDSANGLTAELPWDTGSTSVLSCDRTSLLRLRTDMPHPAMGSGLFFQLVLPSSNHTEGLPEMANRLNLFEFDAIDAPPFFGAWCVDFEKKMLAHVGFIPNQLYTPGLATNVAAWMMARNRMARSVLANIQSAD